MLTEKEMFELKKLCAHRGWVSEGVNKTLCASLVRKGMAEKCVHSEQVRGERRIQWTLYRPTDSGRLVTHNVK